MTATSVFSANNTALITGGASGIGLAVAQLCRRHGMRVVIADWNPENLGTAKEVLGSGEAVAIYQMDVSKLEQWVGLRDHVLNRFGSVDFLMLNAGYSMKGRWGDSKYFEKSLSINLFGVLNGINTFLPVIQAQDAEKAATIVITGSKLGITSQPGCPAYNASKSAVKTLAEHLSFDLRNTRTKVHLLVPGLTFTSIGRRKSPPTEEKPPGAWTAEQVANYMYDKMAENKFYILCPDNNVSEEMEKCRILWSAQDILHDRPPLSRWREGYKDEYEEWIKRIDM